MMANYWAQNGFLQVEGEKMAKSLGNFVTIRDLLKDWPGEVIRLTMLLTHYRQPLNWTTNALRESQRTLDYWYELTADAVPSNLSADVVAALSDDLNTPKAVASLHELRIAATKGDPGARGSLKASAQLIGLLQHTAVQWVNFRRASIVIDENMVSALIAARSAARQAKNFSESDRIRDELAKMGVVVKDTKDGTTWEIAR
jgi:cysteinyl-tRNA synthetase